MRILEKLTLFTAFCLVAGVFVLNYGGAAIARAVGFTGDDHSSVPGQVLVILSVAAAICAVLRLFAQFSTQQTD